MSYIEFVTNAPQADDLLSSLMAANNFTAQDLAENRAGRIAHGQMRMLFARVVSPLRYTGGALFGWLLACWCVDTVVPDLILAVAAMIGGAALQVSFWGITIPCAIAFIVSLFRSSGTAARLMTDLSRGKASFLEGRITISHEEEKGLGLAKLHQQKHRKGAYVYQDWRFEVEEEALNALEPGYRYRLYYTPQSKLLLSIEPAPANA